jgi:hypothetical protein
MCAQDAVAHFELPVLLLYLTVLRMHCELSLLLLVLLLLLLLPLKSLSQVHAAAVHAPLLRAGVGVLMHKL